MLKANVQVKNADRAKRSVSALIKRLEGKSQVLVGVQKGTPAKGKGTLAEIAAANHFGATMQVENKGGVSYGYKNKKAAEDGKVRFLKSREGFMELGKTKASSSTVTIPARPFLDVAVAENQNRYATIFKKQIPKVLDGSIDAEQMLNSVGKAASSDVQKFMFELKDPPNSPSTIAKKKSNNPLIDTGHLRQSIRHEIAQESVEEGIS